MIMERGKLLHSFTGDETERRQYRRVPLQFPLWWLKDRKVDNPVPGIGIEISGGGLKFLLQNRIARIACSIAFRVSDRCMRANISIIHSVEVVFKGQAWQQYSAKFEGLMNTDFDFVVAFTGPIQIGRAHV